MDQRTLLPRTSHPPAQQPGNGGLQRAAVHDAPQGVRDALRSPGQPLDAETRADMESRLSGLTDLKMPERAAPGRTLAVMPRLDPTESQARAMAELANPAAIQPTAPTADFSRVRVHTGSTAAAAADQIGARAYTVGSDIAFAAGQYRPGTAAGRRLLVHELVHVMQQARMASGYVQLDQAPKGGSTPTTGSPDKTLWFQDPKVAGDPTQPDRKRVLTEATLSKVGTVNVRFAYPQSELVASGYVSKPSQKIEDAKKKILTYISEVIVDLGSYPAGTAAEQTKWQQDRARLKEAFAGLTAAKPLNIFIASIDSPAELATGKYIPYTDQVYINVADVGNKAKLEAAIRLPLQNLAGGISAQTGQRASAQSKDELKKTLLHESLHVLLINRGLDSETMWAKTQAQLKIQGPADVKAKAEELVHKYLLAQEETFVYDAVALLYPPVDQVKASYDVFISSAERLLKNKGAKLTLITQSLPVSEKVEKKSVSWSITYKQPDALTLQASDSQVLDLVLLAWPLAQIKGKGTP